MPTTEDTSSRRSSIRLVHCLGEIEGEEREGGIARERVRERKREGGEQRERERGRDREGGRQKK